MWVVVAQTDQLVTFDMSPGASSGWLLGQPGGRWLLAIGLGLGIALWLLVARSSLVSGGNMDRPERVAQLYGYSVCLIAIVVMLVSISSMVDKLFTLSDPLASAGGSFGWGGGPILTSFEAYKATMDRVMAPVPPGSRDSSAARPTETELRARYEALRADQLARSRLEARRDLTSSVILLLVAAVLFWSHWRWVRRSVVPPPAAA